MAFIHLYNSSQVLNLSNGDYNSMLTKGITEDLDNIEAFSLLYPANLNSSKKLKINQKMFFNRLFNEAKHLSLLKICLTRSTEESELVQALPCSGFLRLHQIVHLDIRLAGLSRKKIRLIWSWIAGIKSTLEFLSCQAYTIESERITASIGIEVRELLQLPISFDTPYLNSVDICLLFLSPLTPRVKVLSLVADGAADKALAKAVFSSLERGKRDCYCASTINSFSNILSDAEDIIYMNKAIAGRFSLP